MKYLTILFVMLPLSIIYSQESTKHVSKSWNTLIINYSLNNNLFLKNEVHLRRTNFLADWNQFVWRPSFHAILNKNIDISIGYAFLNNYRDHYQFVENNISQQVLISQKIGKSSIKHRFRYEQRFIENYVKISDAAYQKEGVNFRTRFRYRFIWSISLIKLKTKTLKLTAFDEIWLHTGEGIIPKSLQQNWFYTGFSFPILKKTSLSMGYLNSYSSSGTNQYTSNHILQTTLVYKI